MPEGIEVRKYCDILRANIINHEITAITILKGRYTKKPFEGYSELVANLPLTIKSITNKGKFTYFTLESITANTVKTFYLLATLGMGGGWTILKKSVSDFNKKTEIQGKIVDIDIRFSKGSGGGVYSYPYLLEYVTNNNMDSWIKKILDNLNVEFTLDDSSKFYFYDNRNFGTLKAVDTKLAIDKKLKEIGPDMMDIEFDIFKKAIAAGKNADKAIGNVIVNQKLVSGIGNYLRADILWMAKISPFRKVSTITDTELHNIYNCARAIMWGDYNLEYAKSNGLITKGVKIPRDYNRDFLVYMQKTDPNGESVIKEPLYEGSTKRFIHWVAAVQK